MDQTFLGFKVITPFEAYALNTITEALQGQRKAEQDMAYNKVTIKLELSIDADNLQEFLSEDWDSLKDEIENYCSIEDAQVTVPAGNEITITLDY